MTYFIFTYSVLLITSQFSLVANIDLLMLIKSLNAFRKSKHFQGEWVCPAVGKKDIALKSRNKSSSIYIFYLHAAKICLGSVMHVNSVNDIAFA